MKLTSIKHLFIGLSMLAAAGLAFALTPRERIADQGPTIDLETMIPNQLGQWIRNGTIVPVQVSPDVQAALAEMYKQTLTRTCVNAKHERILLLIAYGVVQGDNVQRAWLIEAEKL